MNRDFFYVTALSYLNRSRQLISRSSRDKIQNPKTAIKKTNKLSLFAFALKFISQNLIPHG